MGERARNGQGGNGQIRAEANARGQQLRELQQQMQQSGLPAESVAPAMRALRNNRFIEAARLLEDVEFELRRIAQTDAAQRLFTNGRGRVPDAYRKAVEQYYRSLSR